MRQDRPEALSGRRGSGPGRPRSTAKAQLVKDQANLVYTKLAQERDDDLLLKENCNLS